MSTFNLDYELSYQPADVIRREQERLLNEHVQHCRLHSPFYRDKLAHLPNRPLTLDDLKDLPLTSKHDVHERNEDFIAVPQRDISDIVFTSGTTGRPCKIVYTFNDIHRLGYNDAVGFKSTGMNAEDIALITCTLDRCFIAGLAYSTGVVLLGGAVIRNGLNTLESHADIIQNNKVTAIVGVPSFLAKLGQFLSDNTIDLSGIKHILCIGEPLYTKEMQRTPLAQKLELFWPGCVYSTYASSEMVTSFNECKERRGGHPPADLGLVEIVDDEGNPLPPGEVGEVVVTPLQVQGMPLIRFKTGDLSFILPEPCPCGRHTPRLGPIFARKSQMLKVKGTTLYPASFFNVLEQIDAVDNFYMEVSGTGLSDEIDLYISFKEGDMESNHIREKLIAKTRVNVRLHTVTPQDAHKKVFGSTRKPLRFYDLR